MALSPNSKVRPQAGDAPLSAFQLMIVGLCVLINVCDGLDTTAIAYAAPALIKDWNLPAQTLGIILSSGSAGMMVGALVIAPLADKLGRRPMILAGVLSSTISMFGLALSQSVEMLILFRFIAGMAIGSLLPSLSVMVVEYSNEARGNFFIAMVHMGFAFGAALGGALGASLLGDYGWRAIFLAAGFITGGVAAVTFFFLPESIYFLTTKQPANALARSNKVLKKLRLPEMDSLPDKPEEPAQRAPIAVGAILANPFLFATLFLWLAAFLRYFISYFLTGWKPQVLVMAGFTAEKAAAVGIVTSLAASVGVFGMGLLTTKVRPPYATAITFTLAAISLVGFGIFSDPYALVGFAILSMFAIESTFTGIMITAARLYPDSMRATGIGYAVGIGRFGAILGPYFGGVVIGLGFERSTYLPLYAGLAILGAVAIIRVGMIAAKWTRSPAPQGA
ncbi:MAG: MFS transporter [Sphingobium sp.]